jgi:CubicO group peptidase (beta-lactamase class C family)
MTNHNKYLTRLFLFLSFLLTILLYQYSYASPPPYPRSDVIRKVTFSPVKSIVRKAIGSDIWPMTWGEDNDLYTAWGDGKGFYPYTKEKYSLGISRIIGPPEDFRGINLPSPSTSTMQGKLGPKSSGLLMVDGTIYMWVRNTGNSTLVWSKDYAKTWTWGFRLRKSFGSPTFLNFGKGYSGARDKYVYLYSQDGPSAYEAYDRVVLARVPKDRIPDRDSYQFYEGMDDRGNPVWTSDFDRRGAVFEYAGHCMRTDVVYNPGIKRYLMTVGYDFHGGWGIYDAPEPWGPWTVAFHTSKWDIGNIHSYRIPSKWIDPNGTTMSLVFSGYRGETYDAFSVRKITFSLFGTDLPEATRRPGGFAWDYDFPTLHGISAEGLEKARKVLEKKRTDALVVIRDDQIVLEWYGEGWNRTRKHYMASLSKSLVGGMALLIALNDGRMTVDSFTSEFIPEWKKDRMKTKITTRMLATHSGGIEDAEEDGLPHERLGGWKGQFWKRVPDPFTVSRDKAPIIFPPGSRYAYSNPGFAILAYQITASLKNAPQPDIYTLLKDRIMDPVGATADEWSISYGNTGFDVDGMKLYAIWGGGAFTVPTVAKIGRLMLRKGNWEGRQLVESSWVNRMMSYAGTPVPARPGGAPKPAMALCWYTNFDGVWSSLPRDAIVGEGAGHQILLIIPSLDMIVVRLGETMEDNVGLDEWLHKYIINPIMGKRSETGYWGAAEKYLFAPIMEALE